MANSDTKKSNPIGTLESNEDWAIIRLDDTEKLNEALAALADAGIPYEVISIH